MDIIYNFLRTKFDTLKVECLENRGHLTGNQILFILPKTQEY